MEPLQRRISNASADSDDFKKKVRSVKRLGPGRQGGMVMPWWAYRDV